MIPPRLFPVAVMLALGALATCALAQDSDPDGEQKKRSLLGRLNLQPKFFQPTEQDKEGSLGFSYDINETVATPAGKVDLGNGKYRVVNLNFKAEGNVAFKQAANPADFLKTGFELNYVYSDGRVTYISPEGTGCDMNDPDTVEDCRRLGIGRDAGLRVRAGAIGSFESDQQFDKNNKTYGGHITTIYKPASNSLPAQLNLFDWPFRLLRRASGHPLGGDPSPDAFPNLRLALERVKPDDDPDRKAILQTVSDYNRGNMEIALTSPVGTIDGKQVKFEWSWRYFKEFGADEAIRAAGLDRFRYSAAALRLDSGWVITYATGKLPLNRQSEAAWELGYRIKFD